MIQSIAPILPVRDMAASIAFYQQLGFQIEGYEGGTDYAFVSLDDVAFHLRRMGASESAFGNPGGVYFYLHDADLFFDQITAAGVPTLHAPEDKPWRMREFAVSDPDGTLLRFGQRSHVP